MSASTVQLIGVVLSGVLGVSLSLSILGNLVYALFSPRHRRLLLNEAWLPFLVVGSIVLMVPLLLVHL